MTKKECRRRPITASWVETLDFQKRAEDDQKRMSLQTQSFRAGWRLSISKKRAEDDQKRMSPQTQSCQLGRETLDFASWKKGPKNTQKRILEEGGEWSLESNKLCLRRRVSPIGGTFTGSRDAVLIESFADPLHMDSSRTQEPFVSCLGSASTQY